MFVVLENLVPEGNEAGMHKKERRREGEKEKNGM